MKKLIWLWLWLGLPLLAGLDEAWEALVAENRYQEARTLFEETDDPLARIGWFLTFSGKGPRPEVQEAALSLLRTDSDEAEFVLKWMGRYDTCLGSWVAAANAAIADRQPDNPELKVAYADLRRDLARNLEATPRYTEIADRAGFVTQWKISERFGAYPIPAFEQAWPPEKPDYWRNPFEYETRTGVVVPPRESLGSGVLYAFSTFHNPVDQELVFRLFSYQNVVMYVDGRLWGRFDHLEKISPNIRFLKGRVPAGKHEILLKTTQTRANDGQFSLQITGKKAPTFPPPGLPGQALKGRRGSVSQPKVGLAARVAASDHGLARFVRAVLALKHKDDQAALRDLEFLYERYPQSQLIGELLARIYMDRVRYLPQEDQLARAFQILQALAGDETAPNVESRMALALLLHTANQTRPALTLLNQVLEANPAYCEALETRLLLARSEALHDVRQQTLDLLNAMGPDHRWAQQQLLDEAEDEGNLDRTRALLANLGRLLPWEGYLAKLHEMNEDYETAVEDLKKRWEIFSTRDFYPYAIAEAYAQLGDRAAQREWLERTLSVNPVHREALLDLVNLDTYEGMRDRAMERMREYLLIEPADAAFRQRLSHMEGATAFESFRVDTDSVIEAAKNKPISKGADSELLLDQLMVRLFPDGSQMRYTHLVTRVLTKEGVDEESELRLPENLEILELRTVKADGSVYYPENIAHKSTVSLTGIGVGDFIDEEHIEYLPPAYYDHDGLDASMSFIFQGVDRIYHHSELVLIYPAGLKPEPVLLTRNMPVEAEIEEKDGFVTVRWLTENMPPLNVETGMPPMGFVQPAATFFYNSDWREIRDFYFNAVRLRMGLSDRVLAEVETWKASDRSPVDLAKQVYEEVTDRLEPDGQFYKNVNLAWETKSGIATLLLASIYSALGMDADLVLVNPEQARHYLFTTPMPSYTYGLIRLRLDGQTHWLDPNNKGLAFGYIPFPYRGSEGLVLDPTEGLYDRVPAFDDETEKVESSYTILFKPDGGARGLGTEKFHGLFAAQLSEKYATLNRPETKQRIEAGINQTFPGAVVSEVTIEENLPRGEFELSHVFNHPNLAKIEENLISFPILMPKTPLFERYGGPPNRETPVNIAQPHYNVTTMRLVLPEGYRWDAIPKSHRVDSKFGNYELAFESEEDRSLTLTRTYHVPARFVAPEDYEDFLVFCRAMMENEDTIFQASKDTGQP